MSPLCKRHCTHPGAVRYLGTAAACYKLSMRREFSAGGVAKLWGLADVQIGDRIGERMRSRLHEMCRIIKMEGEDFRQKFRSASFR